MYNINAIMIPDAIRKAPQLVRGPTAAIVKRRLIGRLDAQPGDVIFNKMVRENHSVQVGVGTDSIHIGTVWLVPDKVAEAFQLTRYMELFKESWGPNHATILASCEATKDVKRIVSEICYEHHLEVDWFADYNNGVGWTNQE